MPFGFYYPTKAGQTNKWEPEYGPSLPVRRKKDYEEQLSDVASGGVIYVQEKGAGRQRFILEFEFVSQTDLDSYVAFFDVVKKSFHKFEWDDNAGNVRTVRIMTPLEDSKNNPTLYDFTVELREE